MPTPTSSATALRCVDAIAELASRIEFEAAIDDRSRPPLGHLLHRPRALLSDLRSEAHRLDAIGVQVYQLAADALAAITAAINDHDRQQVRHGCGTLDQWRSCDEHVQTTVANLRHLVNPPLAGALVVPRAVPARPTAPHQPPDTPGRAEDKVRTDPANATVDDIIKTLTPAARRILKAMRSAGAASEDDRLTAESIIEEIQDQQGFEMTKGQIRRPMDLLKRLGLIQPGRGRGTWLTPLGMAVANAL